MSTPKLKTIKRNVKHVFTPAETADLHTEFSQAYNTLGAVQKEMGSVNKTYKAKESEAESRMATLNATIQAGFEYRDKECVVIMDFKLGKKSFYLETDLDEKGEINAGVQPLIVESVTDADRQQDLLDAEAKFEKREEIELFAKAGEDSGVLIIGRHEDKWFTALRVKVGQRILNERLDTEQPCSKKRPDQVKRAVKRFGEWLDETLGREEAKGFKNAIELVKAEQSEREE